MIQLYTSPLSANCYKVKLLLSQLEIPFETTEVSVFGDRDKERGPGFFAKNPIGKIPTVVLDDGTAIGESMAILWYFAEGTRYLPEDKLARTRVMQWMAFEQNNVEPTLATARHQMAHCNFEPDEQLLGAWQGGGKRALRVMNDWLADHDFFVNDEYSIADIALFGYTHVCEEGPFSLDPYPNVQAWIARVRQQPGFVPMA